MFRPLSSGKRSLLNFHATRYVGRTIPRAACWPEAERHASGGSATFVSSHFRIDPATISTYLDRRGLGYRENPTHTIVKACPLCAKPHQDKVDNLWKLYIRKADGAYFCHRCGNSGSWYDFKQKLGDLPAADDIKSSASASAPGRAVASSLGPPSRGLVSPPVAAGSSSAGALAVNTDFVARASRDLLEENRFPDVLRYLTEVRKLDIATLRRYCVGAVTRDVPVQAKPAATGDGAPSLASGGISSDPADSFGAIGGGSNPSAGGSAVTWEKHSCIVFPWITLKDGTPSAAAGSNQARGAQRSHAHAAAAPSVFGIDAGMAIPAALEGFAAAGGPGGIPDVFTDPSRYVCGRVKLRSVRDKSAQMLLPRGGGWGMFGWHTVPPPAVTTSGSLSVPLSFSASGSTSGSAGDAATIVLTEGEFDAMSVAQETGLPSVSLPNGCRSMPVELLPQLERFSRILLWMDDDLAGREGADRVSEKLGMGRCHIVRPSPGLILPKLPPPAAAAADASGGSSAAPADGDAAAASAPLPGGDPAVALPKDANEMLQRGLDLRPLVAAAAPRRHDQILDFSELRGAVMREVAASLGVFDSQYGAGRRDAAGNFRSAAGVPYRSLPRLQRLLKGHRPGEVTIVTGPTGSGKTTLLSQLSLDLAAQGVRTLWGSFEIKHARLIAAMLTQLRSGRIPLEGDLAMQMQLALGAQRQLQRGSKGAGSQGAAPAGGRGLPAFASTGVAAASPDDWLASPPPSVAAAHPAAPFSSSATSAERALLQSYERAADVLGALPLQFLRFYGSSDVDRVVDALEYASYVHDTEHVILDNLQFMMSASGSGRGGGMFDRFEAQERALDKFRAFATRHDVHLTLVIHPRKEPEDAPLSMSSVFGSAKATQEADTVYILQRAPDGRKYIDVKKNRYDGSVGMVPLAFDPDAKCFSEHEAVVMGGSASDSAPAGGAGAGRGGQGAAAGSGGAPAGGGDSASRRRPSAAGAPQTRSFSTSARSPTASTRCCAGERGFNTAAHCHAAAAAGTGYAKKSPEFWRQLYARKAVAAAVAAAAPERALLRQRLAGELEEDLTQVVLPAFRLHPVHSDAEDAQPAVSTATASNPGEDLRPNVS